MTETYYDQSYPPSLYRTPAVPATGATAGIPGTWTPAGSQPPASVADLAAGTPNAVVASPATAWTTGQYVQTQTIGAAGRASWSGTNWVGGAAPLAEQENEMSPEEPDVPPEDVPEEPEVPEDVPEA